MRQKVKTFNIGETVLGGTIRVKIKHNITIDFCSYKTKNVIDGAIFNPLLMTDIHDFLNENATPYHADIVYQWILKNNSIRKDNKNELL